MSGASELASTLQSASITANPDPKYDLNPSTAASHKTPVRLRSHASDPLADAESETATHEIPTSVLEAPPRKQTLPPLPDLRFEQSYLARVRPYLESKRYWLVAWLTVLDHVFMPFAQGIAWNLAVLGWRAWNTAAKFHGESTGARIRRWWWNTNNWSLPASASASAAAAGASSLPSKGG